MFLPLFRFRKNSKTYTESEIVDLAKSDLSYFGKLYEMYFERIFRFIFKRLGGDENVAADLTQQSFMKAMANIRRYEDRGLSFCSWLYRIAQNEVNMYFRSLQKTATIAINEKQFKELCSEAQITGYMTVEEQEQLISLLNQLEQEHLDLIELRFFQGMSFKEIADIYSITEPNAKMRVYRILEKLNKNWKQEG